MTYNDAPLAAQFAALAPEPLEGRWEEVLREAASPQEHYWPVERSEVSHVRRRYLVAIIAAVLVAAIGTAAYGTVRILVLDQGFIGLPPIGATPSSPESGELVVEWFAFAPSLRPQKAGVDMVRTWVYADGRIIWDRRPHGPGAKIPEGANAFNSGYLEQRLSPDGVELVRAAVARLFDESRPLADTIPALDDPWWGGHPFHSALWVPDDYGSEWGIIAIPQDDRLARLRIQIAGERDDLNLAGTLATPEQLSALQRVAALLNDPSSVLPASAWAEQKVRAYVPSHYAVCIDTSPPKTSSELLSMLPPRAAGLLQDQSRSRSEGELLEGRENGRIAVAGRTVRDCYRVETAEAREVAAALSGLVPERGSETYGLKWRVDTAIDGDPAESNETDVSFEPYLPDGQIVFSGAFG